MRWETSAAARRPDRFGQTYMSRALQIYEYGTRGRRKRSGQKRARRATTNPEVLGFPQRADCGAGRSATVGEAFGVGALQLVSPDRCFETTREERAAYSRMCWT